MEINPKGEAIFLSSFAGTVGSEVINGRVDIPGKYGSGYLMGFLFGDRLRMIVRNYALNEEILIKRDPERLAKNMILITLNNIVKSQKQKSEDSTGPQGHLPSVTITTRGLEPELHLSSKTNFNAIHLGIDAAYLRALLDSNMENTILKNIAENNQSLVFEQLVSLNLQKIAAEITDTAVAPALQHFFYKLKAEELVCYLFMELIQRDDCNLQSVNVVDMQVLYKIRDRLLIDLANAPTLKELASEAGMSDSKLKRLFKQVFGDSIYSYYQKIRMNEAAYLLKQEKRSVSEVGYALGFTNLGHFTRVFEEHMGMKPKKFSAS